MSHALPVGLIVRSLGFLEDSRVLAALVENPEGHLELWTRAVEGEGYKKLDFAADVRVDEAVFGRAEIVCILKRADRHGAWHRSELVVLDRSGQLIHRLPLNDRGDHPIGLVRYDGVSGLICRVAHVERAEPGHIEFGFFIGSVNPATGDIRLICPLATPFA